MSRYVRNAAALSVAAVLVCGAAACGDDSPSASPVSPPSVSGSTTGSAQPTSSPTTSSNARDYPKASLKATLRGAMKGPMTYVGAEGCRIVDEPGGGVVRSSAMGVSLPGGKQGLFIVGVRKDGRQNDFSGSRSGGELILMTEGQVWQTGVKGGKGSAELLRKGAEGTFEGTLVDANGAKLRVKGELTCG